jgi:hypothetical protein
MSAFGVFILAFMLAFHLMNSGHWWTFAADDVYKDSRIYVEGIDTTIASF